MALYAYWAMCQFVNYAAYDYLEVRLLTRAISSPRQNYLWTQ